MPEAVAVFMAASGYGANVTESCQACCPAVIFAGPRHHAGVGHAVVEEGLDLQGDEEKPELRLQPHVGRLQYRLGVAPLQPAGGRKRCSVRW